MNTQCCTSQFTITFRSVQQLCDIEGSRCKSGLVGKLRVAPRLPSVGWQVFEPSVRLPSNVVNYCVSCCLPCLLQPCYSSPESLQLGSDRQLKYKSSGGKSWLKSKLTSKSCHKPLDTQLKSLTRYAVSGLCPKMRIIMQSNGAW